MCEAVISAGPKTDTRVASNLSKLYLCSMDDCGLLSKWMVFVGFSSTVYNVVYRLFLGTYLTHYTIL